MVEDRIHGYQELLKQAHLMSRGVDVIGITGPAGSGKSTLVSGLIGEYRKAGKTVGVVAVDPSSPFSGGAVLGDRLRMQAHFLDQGVFIRSLATRGSLGGLSAAAGDFVTLLDAAGYDVILVETVGAGQSEVDIMKLADTVIVVVVPGLGDEIQAIKAGLLEIGDVFVVNKADRDGADRTAAEIEMMLDMKSWSGWRPIVVRTVAVTEEGVPQLFEAVQRHGKYLVASGEYERRKVASRSAEIEAVLEEAVKTAILKPAVEDGFLRELASKVQSRELDPYEAVSCLMQRYGFPLIQCEKGKRVTPK
ncbi:MAG TPA: methylmalonyl Co-A mutase-associated GTPase MeaB [Firmicutes bacterium]|nr:methylmalonyl Co-A mutase-associated GTPase MeaB [Bacillota bacterium]